MGRNAWLLCLFSRNNRGGARNENNNKTSDDDANDGNGDTENTSMEMTARTGFVPVFLYTRQMTLPPGDPFRVAYRDGLTAEALCFAAGRECGISRLSAALFGIYDRTASEWLHPAARVTPSDAALAFRLRFHVSHSVGNVTSLEESLVAYMFAQYRHAFLHGGMTGISMEVSLGLVVLDMVRHACENTVSIGSCLRRSHFRWFLPSSLAVGLNPLEEWKLKKKIRRSLAEFRRVERSPSNYRMMFLISLMEEKKSWPVKMFETVKEQRFEVCISTKGIKQVTPADQASTFKLLFEDILSIAMMASRAADSSNWVVLVNQRAEAPKEFIMESKRKAESLVSLIDGYCRLHVDYYHYLYHECAPPSLVQLVKSRCHGPIPRSCAMKKVEQSGPDDGNYLIRQNPEDFYSYCLTVRMSSAIKNYKILIGEDGWIGLPGQRTFPDIRTLVDHYRSSVNCACLDGPLGKAIPFQTKEESLHMHDLSILPEPPKPPPPDPPIEWIHKDNISNRKHWRKLGGGTYTTVYRGEINTRGKGWTQVAIKCPRRSAPHSVQQKFSQSVDIMSSWSNQSIICFLGIGAEFSMIMEYAPFGSMDTFLRKHQSQIGQCHQLVLAVQLIDALEYLASRKMVHGNMTAHNVVVVRNMPQLRVKLCDPMLSSYYHSLPMDRKMERVRWTAPELLHSNVEPTLESDVWSFGMTLWQIMAYGKIPYEGKTNEEVMRLYTSCTFPPYPPDSSKPINDLLFNCWRREPGERSVSKHLLRELNRIYMRFQELEGSDALYWEVPDDDDVIDAIGEYFSEEEEEENSEDETGDEDDDDETNLLMCPVPFPAMATTISPPQPLVGGGANFMPPPQASNYSKQSGLMKFSGIEKVQEGTLELQEELGAGNFGIVFKGVWKRAQGNCLPVAIKEIKKEKSTPEELKQFEEEIRQMSLCDHKNIVKVQGVMSGGEDNPLRLVMEYVPHGSLSQYLKKRKDKRQAMSHQTMLLIGQQVSQGMAYLADRHIVHRDLAARNVLVSADESDGTDMEVKISDFGLARRYTTDRYYVPSGKSRHLPLMFFAIECFGSDGKFSSQSDVWNFGVLLWEIFSYGETPWYKKGSVILEKAHEVYAFLKAGNRLPVPSGCPQSVFTVMTQCWHMDKNSRPTFRLLIIHLGRMLESDMNT